MDAIRKLMEQAQQLQEMAMQAQLDQIQINETSVGDKWSNTGPEEPDKWSSNQQSARGNWSAEGPSRPQSWSAQAPQGPERWSDEHRQAQARKQQQQAQAQQRARQQQGKKKGKAEPSRPVPEPVRVAPEAPPAPAARTSGAGGPLTALRDRRYLRDSFIMREVLGPPLALRDEA